MQGSRLLYVFLAFSFVAGNAFWISQVSTVAYDRDVQTAAVSGRFSQTVPLPTPRPASAPQGTVTSEEPQSADETVSTGSAGKPQDKASGDCTKAKRDAAQKAGGKTWQDYQKKCASKKGKLTYRTPSGQ